MKRARNATLPQYAKFAEIRHAHSIVHNNLNWSAISTHAPVSSPIAPLLFPSSASFDPGEFTLAAAN